MQNFSMTQPLKKNHNRYDSSGYNTVSVTTTPGVGSFDQQQRMVANNNKYNPAITIQEYDEDNDEELGFQEEVLQE